MEALHTYRPRIAVLGASSISLGPQIISDLLQEPSLDGAEFFLMAPHRARLGVVERWAERVIEYRKLTSVIRATTHMRTALEGADFVIALFDAGGHDAFEKDFQIASSFGLDICIGDTMGPTSMMKALRNIKTLEQIARDFNELCPDALLLNYVNPMAPVMMAAHEFGIRNAVGLCSGVETTRELIAYCMNEQLDSLDTRFAGINHMNWALRIEQDGFNLYPRFRETMTQPEWRASEPVRSELLQHFGYFPAESSGHLSDMLHWFRKDEVTRTRYGSAPGYAGKSGIYHRYKSYLHKRLDDEDYLRYESDFLFPKSNDYGASIISAICTNESYYAYGNVINNNLIDNLSPRSCVEIPIAADAKGIRPEKIGALPSQLAALCTSNIIVQELVLDSVIEGDPELAAAAVSLDPATQAVCDLPQSRNLTKSLLKANQKLIPAALARNLSPVYPVGTDVNANNVPVSKDEDKPLKMLRKFDLKRRQK